MDNPFDWNGTPIINYACRGDGSHFKDLQSQLMQLHCSHSHKKVEWHKKQLGAPKTTWTGEYRFQVWEGKDWRVLVNNIYGISFEVREGLMVEQALAAWNDYRKQMGMHDGKAGSTTLGRRIHR